MSKSNETSILNAKIGRIEMVDALRGFAVLAILLVHSVEHFIFPIFPTDSPEWLKTLDKGVFDIVFFLFGGKAYAIFSILFGFTFSIQCANQRRKGKDFGYRFLWRILLLFAFATLNAAFFPAGDVLLLYAVIAVVLFVVRNWSNRAILIAAIFFTLQPIEWYHYIMWLLTPSHPLPDYGVAAMYSQVFDVTKSGTFWEFIWCNVTLGQKASFMWAVGAGRVLQTAGLFLIGLYIGRCQLFVSNEKNIAFWRGVFVKSIVAFIPLYIAHSIILSEVPDVRQTIGVVLDMWHKLAFTFFLISTFVLIYQKEWFQQRVTSLRYYGRMSLTSYLSQSLIGALIYFPFGLYLAPYCGYTLSLLIGFAVFFVQVGFSKWWFKSHTQGPLEWLWHKWTWSW